MILNYLQPKTYLTAEQEKEICVLCKQNDNCAKENLILSNIKYIYVEAKKLAGSNIPIDELVMEGICGLLEALKNYNINRNARFMTYAYFWIKKTMLDMVYKQGSIVHLGAAKARQVAKLRKTCAKLSYKNNPEILKEASIACSCTEAEARELLNVTADYASLDRDVSYANGSSVIDFLQDDKPSPEEEYMIKNEKNRLVQALKQLSPMEQEVLVRHYGLFNYPSQSFSEIAEIYHKTKARIHQIEKDAKDKLKNKLSA